MAEGRFVSYLRVSTDKQGRSGLGLDAQRETVNQALNGGQWELVAEFVEIESGTAKGNDRPQLAKALARCRVMGARLIVANVSRLTRSPDFMSRLAEAGVDVWFCDLPRIDGPVGTFMLRQMLAVAELEAGFIGERTRKALAQAKARGVKLGGIRSTHVERYGPKGNLPEVADKGRVVAVARQKDRAKRQAADLAPILADIQADGASSLRQIAAGLNARNIRTTRGGEWSAVQVKRVLERTESKVG